MDTTFFKRNFGVMVFRGNPDKKYINLRWKYMKSETIREYHCNIHALAQKYRIKSFTADNRTGLVKMLERKYPGIPVQLCQFHMVMAVRRAVGKKPVSDCGRDLLTLGGRLKSSGKKEFRSLLAEFITTHINYLQQRNHKGGYIHQDIREVISSMIRNIDYLFTFEVYPGLNIPKTTNSAEGSFGHWKYKVRLHRGIKEKRRKQMIDNIIGNNSR